MSKGCASQLENSVDQVETIVMRLMLCGSLDSPATQSMLQVITNMLLEPLPEQLSLGRPTISDDGCEEIAKLQPSLHGTGLLETLDPLLIILKKPSGNASLLEGTMKNTIHSAQSIKRSCTLDCSKEETEVEALATSGNL